MIRRIIAIIALSIAVVTGCATLKPDLPAITEAPTNQQHTGKIVWRDLLTNDPTGSQRFYGELFGWQFEEPGIDLGFGDSDAYTLIRHNGKLIGGMVNTRALGRAENVSQWVSMISVADIERATASITARGGTILTPPTELATRGHLAVAEDPGGAIFALIQARGGDPGDREPVHNDFLWDELWTEDVAGSSDFYAAVFGFQREDHDIDDSDRQYGVLKVDGTPRAGLIEHPVPGERPVWVNYLRVQDPAAVAARVSALGGRVIAEAQPRAIGGTVALVAGPSGAGIALQTWPLD